MVTKLSSISFASPVYIQKMNGAGPRLIHAEQVESLRLLMKVEVYGVCSLNHLLLCTRQQRKGAVQTAQMK